MHGSVCAKKLEQQQSEQHPFREACPHWASVNLKRVPSVTEHTFRVCFSSRKTHSFSTVLPVACRATYSPTFTFALVRLWHVVIDTGVQAVMPFAFAAAWVNFSPALNTCQ